MYAIRVKNLTKIYKLYDKPMDRLVEAIIPSKKTYHKKFYALNHISFDVAQGETVGIIGTNGSGKSTILKIITGVLTPTEGELEVNGKISALLELGAGFNPDYTGMQNIYMNGTMMGFSKKEMDEKVEEILKFADIGDFVNQPVKTYSSGMFVRLAFAIAINVEPEILIVDEALAVGDVFFQAKCYKKINEIKENGTTVLLVTHDMGSVIKYCDRVVLLNKGEFVSEGKPSVMVDLYKKILANQLEEDVEEEKEEENVEETESVVVWKERLNLNSNKLDYGDHKAEIIDFAIVDHRKEISNLVLKDEEFQIKMKVKFKENIENPIFAFTIKDSKGTELTGTNTLIEDCDVQAAEKGKVYTIGFKQRMELQGGEYLLSLGCTGFVAGEFVIYHRLYDIANLTVISEKNTIGVYDMKSLVTIEIQ